MSKRVFLIHTEDVHEAAMRELAKQGLDVVLSTTRGVDDMSTYAPGTSGLHISLADACNGVVPAQMIGKVQPASYEDIDALAPAAVRILNCLDYGAFPQKPVHDLYRLYIHLIGLWASIIDELKPDAVIFNYDVSFRGFDYVLYELCRTRNIRRCIFQYTLIRDRQLLSRDVYDPRGPSMEEILAAPPCAEEESDVDSPGTEAVNKSANDPRRFRRILEWPRIARGLVGRDIFQRYPTPNTYFLYDPMPRMIKYRAWTAAGKALARRCLDAYDRLATNAPPLDVPYLYFPLQVQPEESTSIQGDHFTDHWHVLSVISAALPKGWKIYVKEHPNQFNRGHRMVKGRTLDFYRWLKDVPNAVFLPLEMNPREIIAKSRAVVTGAGSSGWEALKAGRPAIIFGYPWYLRAPGVTQVNSVADLRDALKRVADGKYRVSMDLVQRYEKLMLDKYTHPLLLTHEFLPHADEMAWSMDDHAARYARVIREELEAQGLTIDAVAKSA